VDEEPANENASELNLEEKGVTSADVNDRKRKAADPAADEKEKKKPRLTAEEAVAVKGKFQRSREKASSKYKEIGKVLQEAVCVLFYLVSVILC
jgi:hypothetical protein